MVATHGRSIWVLEDLPALREHRHELDEAPLHLYQPRRQVRWITDRGFPAKGEARRSYSLLGPVVVAYDKRQLPGRTETVNVPVGVGRNPTDGVAVLYRLKDPGDSELRLTFRDAVGREVRTLTARPGDEDRKPEKGKPKDPVPNRREGLNRFVWDGRHGRGTQIEIDPPEDEDAAANLGPAVAPGRYTVRVELGGQAAEAGFEIAADPRSRYTPEQVAVQYELDLRLWGLLSDLYDGVNRARRARSELGESESDLQLRQELEAVEAEPGRGRWRQALHLRPSSCPGHPPGEPARSGRVGAAERPRGGAGGPGSGPAGASAPAAVCRARACPAGAGAKRLTRGVCSAASRIDRRHGGRIAKRC